MRKVFEALKPMWPLALAIIGVSVVESSLTFFPWKVLGIILMGISTGYVVLPILRTNKKEGKGKAKA